MADQQIETGQEQSQEQPSVNPAPSEMESMLAAMDSFPEGMEGSETKETQQVPAEEAKEEKAPISPEISALQAQIAAIAGAVEKLTSFQSQKPNQDQDQQVQQFSEDFSTSVESLISDEEFDKAFENKANFAKLVSKAVELGRTSVLKTIPGMVSSVVAQSTEVRTAIDDFKKNNQEVFTYGVQTKEQQQARLRILGSEVAHIRALHPEYTNQQVLADAGKSIKEMFNIPAKQNGKQQLPFVDSSAPKKQTVVATPLQDEINSMAAALEM